MKYTLIKQNKFGPKKDLTNKIGLGLSITILALVVLALVAVFCDTHTYGNTISQDTGKYIPDPVFSTLNAGLLGYFAFAINIFIGLISIVNIVEFALAEKGKITRVHDILHVLNFTQAVCLAFNFLYTIVYLIPFCCTSGEYNFEYLFTGSNLIFNVATPILGVLLYIFCFKGYSLKNIWLSLLGAIPTITYFTIYLILAFVYSNGNVTNSYWDFYGFGVFNKFYLLIMLAMVVLVSIGMSIGLWKLNQIGNWNRYMIIAVVNIFLVAAIIAFSGVMFNTNVNGDRYIENLGAAETFFLRFVYFTHLSNWWVGATCVIYSIYAIKIYKGQAQGFPIWAQIMRLAGIAAISITLLMQIVVAAAWMFEPLNSGVDWKTALTEGYIKCFRKHLLFEHFVTPFIAIACFIVLEHTDLKWKHLLHAATPMAIYGLCYVIVLYSTLHIPLRSTINPRWTSPWDVYEISKLFGANGKYIYWAVPGVIYILMVALNLAFWYFNRKIHFHKPKKGPIFAELKQDWAKYKKSRK